MRYAPLSNRVDAFIEAASIKHNGKYDYSLVAGDFVNAHTKVSIICPDHGQFSKTPSDHKKGQRCQDCSGRRNSRPEARREQFIARAHEVHGDRYDYSAVIYIDQHTEVTIICLDHGPFPQRPMNHLSSHTPSNCHDCGDATRTKTKRANRAEVVPAWPSYWN